MVATVSHGIVYVVQRDRPSGSNFKKGDRVTMVRHMDKPHKSGEFMYEDGRRVPCPYVNAEDQLVPLAEYADGAGASARRQGDAGVLRAAGF